MLCCCTMYINVVAHDFVFGPFICVSYAPVFYTTTYLYIWVSLLHILVLDMYGHMGNYGFLFSVLWYCFCNWAGGPVLCGLCIRVLTTLIGDGWWICWLRSCHKFALCCLFIFHELTGIILYCKMCCKYVLCISHHRK